MTTVKDYKVFVKVRNARILNAFAEKGESVGLIAANKIGISYQKLLDLSNLKLSPIKKDGSLLPEVEKLCEYLNKIPTDLFSVDQIYPLETNAAEIEMTAEEVEMLMFPASKNINPESFIAYNQAKNTLNELIESLTPRETEVMKLRFGIECDEHTYKKIGEILGVSIERVRQIEAKALRKLKHPSRANKLRLANLDLNFPEEEKK